MFSSIHFLFLLALGVFAWAVLCYVEQIEAYLMCSSSEAQHSSASDQHTAGDATGQGLPTAASPNKSYFYVNLLCIFVCIYALVKVMHMAERYLARAMYGKLYTPPVWEAGSDLNQQKKRETLQLKVQRLERQNLELKLKLHESMGVALKDGSSNMTAQLLGDGDIQQHVYVTNQHYNLNRHIYLNRERCNEKFEDLEEKSGNVWKKYLEMQTKALKEPSTPWTNDQRLLHVPVVMSLEELQKI